MRTPTTSLCVVPLVAGAALWIGATALLTEDAFRSGEVTVNHLLQPLLSAGTVAAAILCHHRLASWRLVSGSAFLVLAVLGSLATIYGTLSRTATARDSQLSVAMAENRTLSLKDEELVQAKAQAKRECATLGPRCQQWQSRVDQLTREMAYLRAVSVDPRGDALVRLAALLGFDSGTVRAIVQAIDPVVLPLFLELSSILFMGAAFPHRNRSATETIAQPLQAATVTIAQSLQRVWTKAEAHQDLKRLREAGSGRYLAARWGRDPATVSRWLAEWSEDGSIARERQGKAIRALTV
jgi:hypothetical protein